MYPIIEVRDVSEKNRQPKKVFSTNIEINKKGHKLYYPSKTHTRYNLVRKFGEDIGNLMFFLLNFPGLEYVCIKSYSLSVALKPNDDSDWSPIIDKMINLSIKSLAEKQQKESVIIQIQVSLNNPVRRWFVDTSNKKLTSTTRQRFWRPIRTVSRKYLRERGAPWTEIVPPILKVPGVEEIGPCPNAFSLEIGDVYVSRWNVIEEQILNILCLAFHQNVIFEHVEK